MTVLANVEDVTVRLPEEPDERTLAHIAVALEDASDAARDYGSQGWNAENCPNPVRRIVAAAVARYIRNPDGFDQSRAADETVGWGDDVVSNRIEFSDEEIARLRRWGTPYQPGFGSFGVVAWGSGPVRDTVFVPWGPHDGSKPFPLIAINDGRGEFRGPWG